MSELPQIEQRLREFLEQTDGSSLEGGSGRVPSTNSDEDWRRGLVDFIAHSWGAVVDESELAPQHLQSLSCLARLVAAKVLGGGHGRTMHCCVPDAFREAANSAGAAD